MIRYTEDMTAIEENMLGGFFVGWPRSPSAAQHLAVLRGSFRAVVAVDDSAGRVAGFVNMISDGVLTAFIPWLEVLHGQLASGRQGRWRRFPPGQGNRSGLRSYNRHGSTIIG